MRQYIILSQADIITLRKNQPVSVCVNDVKYIMCSDECYEQERGSMSNTVKLIIEIPKPMYESVQSGTYCGTLYEELKNGIPLDDVKAEIQNDACNYWGDEFVDGINHALEIIDNIGKREKVET